MIFLAWLTSLVSTLGSLFFSEVMLFPPCLLCWYQRICMYPLVLILFVAFIRDDRRVLPYSLPLSLVGLGIAIYHNLLYYHIIPESLAPCVQGISCTTVQLKWLGFVTIPLLSLTGFILVILFQCLLLRKAHAK